MTCPTHSTSPLGSSHAKTENLVITFAKKIITLPLFRVQVTKISISCMNVIPSWLILHKGTRETWYNDMPCSNCILSQVATTDMRVSGTHNKRTFWAHTLIGHVLHIIFIHYIKVKIPSSRLAHEFFAKKCPKIPILPKSHHVWSQLPFPSHNHITRMSVAYSWKSNFDPMVVFLITYTW